MYRYWLAAMAVLCLLTGGCQKLPGEESSAQTKPAKPASDEGASPKREPGDMPANIHPAAVAGQFYPDDATSLRRTIDQFLAEAKPEGLKNIRALICPHAGYAFSGPIAAAAYKQLIDTNFRTVIIVGTSHFSNFVGAAIPTADYYQTPLGTVRIASLAKELLKTPPFVADPECPIVGHPPLVRGRPHSVEHSVEVQIPFIQRVLPNAEIVPILIGQIGDRLDVARELSKHLSDKTLLVVSTDLSHYLPYASANNMDSATVKSICDLNAAPLTERDACGVAAVEGLLWIAKQKPNFWKAVVLDRRNSGDTTNEKRKVVGYAAIAFCGADAVAVPEAAVTARFDAKDRDFLLKLARRTIGDVVSGREPPKVKPEEVPEKLREPGLCFVTPKNTNPAKGEFRGCIGNPEVKAPLYQAVIDNAVKVTMDDYRVLVKITPAELDEEIDIEISVLTEPKPLEFSSTSEMLAKLRPNVDGVILKFEHAQSTFLPQVWEAFPNKERFLCRLSEKAGMPPFSWAKPNVKVLTYQAEVFHENRAQREKTEK